VSVATLPEALEQGLIHIGEQMVYVPIGHCLKDIVSLDRSLAPACQNPAAGRFSASLREAKLFSRPLVSLTQAAKSAKDYWFSFFASACHNTTADRTLRLPVPACLRADTHRQARQTGLCERHKVFLSPVILYSEKPPARETGRGCSFVACKRCRCLGEEIAPTDVVSSPSSFSRSQQRGGELPSRH